MLVTLFSQYLTNVKIPVPGYSKERGGFYVGRFPLFKLFPVSAGGHFFIFLSVVFPCLNTCLVDCTQVILAIAVSWVICAIITAAGGFPSDPSIPQYMARTDARAAVVKEAKWFRVPYPGKLNNERA